MAEETQTVDTADEWDIDELLKEFEPEVEQVEKQTDDQTAKLTKGMRKLAEKQAKLEEQARVDKLTGDFYEKATDDEKELADVLLAGVADEGRVKKMLDLAKAKAKSLQTEEEEAEEKEAEETDKAFAPAVAPAPAQVDDPWKPVLEQVKAGNTHASFLEFCADDLAFPPSVKNRARG